MSFQAQFERLAGRASLHPDLGRAMRATIAFMVPLLLTAGGWLQIEVLFVAVAAQNIAMLDVRGDYRLRLALVLAMTAVFAGAAGLGALASGGILAAVLATGLMAMLGSIWRHLSSDYGMSLAISSSLVFFIALGSPVGVSAAGSHSLAALLGGLWGVLLQVANWPFRPQHPLRRAVADSWLAVADVFEAMIPSSPVAEPRRNPAEREAALRTALDSTYAALEAARPGLLRQRLETLNLAAARLATRVVVLNTALESATVGAAYAALAPALQPVLTSLTNTSRTVALAVVSRQPAHLAACEVRLRRLTNLLRVLRTRVTAQAPDSPASAQLLEILRQIEQHLPAIHDALRATIERADERGQFSLELFDLHNLTLRPLASALNFSRQVDPALVRFTVRTAVLTMLGVVVFKALALPHGYWLPFTMVVVLQPDYGSTRQRAVQRVLGTLAGSGLASALLWLHLPFAALMAATAATIFGFGYFLKRNYAVAVFFVTLFVVLLTETGAPVTVAFTLERLAITLAGGALALLAANFFWPVWERDRFPSILARALQANRRYLELLTERLAGGGNYDAEAVAAKRRAEAANSAAFSSLQRMGGDPKSRQDGIEQAATLANGNQRLTRVLNVLTLHFKPAQPLRRPELARFARIAGDALDTLARAVENSPPAAATLEPLVADLGAYPGPSAGTGSHGADAEREHWVLGQLTRAATELSAMLLAIQDAAPAPSGDTHED